ncbi:replication initiation protein [Polaromonas sp. UBA4122]|uniref:replication initiation protein n=1 Tax=Polaromonas sp. UBA4122 TaxID=1947074 RepID=UPI0026010891|nr:replication initiation protein [Polaromonas sp. UBA4122]
MDPHQKINKPVSTLAIIPKTGSITRLGRQAYAVMLMSAREQAAEDVETGMFSSPLHAVIEGFDGNKESMKVLKSTLRSMVSSVIEWQSPTDGESAEWNACGLLSGAKIKVIKGENHIFWAYAPNLRSELLNPQRYAQLQRSTISKAKSHAGLALYENCVRYKDVPSGLTSEHPWEWWVPVLRGKPVKKGKTLEYGIFNRDTLSKAIAEVNEISEISVALREKKSGKSVTTIQFEVRKKPRTAESAQEESQGPVSALSLVKAEKMGIPAKIADEHFGRYGDKAFLGALNKFALRLTQFTAPVENKLAYLKTILENGVAEESVEQLTTSVEAVKEEREPPALSSIQLKQVQMAEQGTSQLETVKKEIAALPEGEKEALVDELKEYMAAQRFSARMRLRVESGELENPIIQGILARIHWKKTRGASWSAES